MHCIKRHVFLYVHYIVHFLLFLLPSLLDWNLIILFLYAVAIMLILAKLKFSCPIMVWNFIVKWQLTFKSLDLSCVILLIIVLQKYFEIDDTFEENKRQHLEKTSSLESIIRLFEVKMKNAQDQSKCCILHWIWNTKILFKKTYG